MKARAPGKIVLSGAYAVLQGAPAIVTAVSRYVIADSARAAEFVTPEVSMALRELGDPPPAAPAFDASALRAHGSKLGLGSSSAILVASLGALDAQNRSAGEGQLSGKETDAWRERVYRRALRVHRQAQAGGSGVDVAAATFGGTLLARLKDHSGEPDADVRGRDLVLDPISLPADLHFEIWAMGRPASTAQFVRSVFALGDSRPLEFDKLLGTQAAAATRAAEAVQRGNTAGFLESLRAQYIALMALGDAAGVPIVLDTVRALQERSRLGGVLLPAGAGGGDVSVYAGTEPSSPEFRQGAKDLGMWLVDAHCGAPGLHADPTPGDISC